MKTESSKRVSIRRKKLAFILKNKVLMFQQVLFIMLIMIRTLMIIFIKSYYDVLWQLVVGLFPSPYAVTSLREYWAKGLNSFIWANARS